MSKCFIHGDYVQGRDVMNKMAKTVCLKFTGPKTVRNSAYLSITISGLMGMNSGELKQVSLPIILPTN